MQENDLTAALVAALTPTFGAALPTREALTHLGINLTPAAICRRRKRGTLPVSEIRDGRTFLVTVLAIAQLLVGSMCATASQPSGKSHAGRPRKRRGPSDDGSDGTSS